MESHNDRVARRLAEIKAELAELDREAAEREAQAADPGPIVVNRRDSGRLRSAAFLIGVLVLAAGLSGSAITLIRLAGDDMADARRSGHAQVSRCTENGPISNSGFGYWDRCRAMITWDGGAVELVTVDGVFNSADIGGTVRVGDLGKYRQDRELVRADASYRPWLAWTGYAIGVVSLVPGLIGAMIIGELLRFRRRRGSDR